MLQDDLNRIRAEATAQLAGASGKKELEELRVRYLGKKGEVTAILKQMGKLSAEERPVVGALANEVREAITQDITARTKELQEAQLQQRLLEETMDVTLPGERPVQGKRQCNLQFFFRQFQNLRHNAAGGNGHISLADMQAVLSRQNVDEFQKIVIVVQRLSGSHHYHI